MRRLAAALAACALCAPFPARASDPYEIHTILSMTGQAGFTGQGEALVLQALENRVNANGGVDGRPIKFIVHDDASNSQLDVQLATELLAKKVAIFLGPSLAAPCSAVAPLVKNGPVSFCLSNAVYPPPGSYMFSAQVTTLDHVATGIRYLRLSNRRRLAMIVTTDTSGQNGEQAIDSVLAKPENRALQLVDREHFNVTDLTVTAQLARIKAAHPDAIILWTTGTPAGTVLRGLSDAGMLDIPVLISPGNATHAQMEQYAQFLPKTLYFTLDAAMLPDRITDRATKAAIDDLRSALASVGAKVDLPVVGTWDSALIVLSALKKLGLNASAEQIRAYIANLKGFTASSGTYDFPAMPQRGLGESAAYLGVWDAAKGTWISVSKAGGAPL